ncbi:histidinol-phosphate transaminase [Colwellia sp. MEBiC06753]
MKIKTKPSNLKSNLNSNLNENISTSVSQLARSELLDMVPYQSARRLQQADKNASDGNEQTVKQANRQIWLNANEASGQGKYSINAENINRYPDFQPEQLLNAYSKYCGLPVDNILATRGADEGIELIIRTFCTAYRDNILICPPTYGMYAISAENHGAGIMRVPLINNLLDVEQIVANAEQVNVIFLCSPGNPTGNLLPADQVKAVLDGVANQCIVVLDEAYIEFAPNDSVLAWLDSYPNLIILRTLSKAFALAGLRCGFTLASTEIIQLMSKVIAPYPISAPVAELASYYLTQDGLSIMQERVQTTNNLREQLSAWLAKQSWCQQVYVSNANFVLFRTPFKDVIFDGLKQQGILIRDQSKQPQLENCLRISIGNASEIDLVKQIISQIMMQQSQPAVTQESK